MRPIAVRAAWLAFLVVAAAGLTAIAGNPAKPKYAVRDWSFTWVVAQSADVQLLVEAEPDRRALRLRSDMSSLTLPADDAVLAGRVLQDASDHIGELGKTGDKWKDVPAGSLTVTFRRSDERGVTIHIRSADGWGSGPFLSRAQAQELAPVLLDAKAILAQLEQTISPCLH